MIEKNEKNIRLLATAYTMAKNYDAAINSWKDATEYAEDAEVFYRLAQALANEDRHKEAVAAYRDALDKEEGLKDLEEVQFWMGISLMQLSEWDDASKAFRAAAKDKDRRKSANQYIQYIANEKKRLAALQEMLTSN